MITCKNVSHEYFAGKPVLKNISLHLEEGSFTFLIGASGAGKSTLLSLLSLAMLPTQGSIRFSGKDITTLARNELPLMRRKIGTVFQDYQLLPHLTIAENVSLPLKISGESQRVIDKKVDELLHWVGLKEFAGVRPDMVSGGQKQRVAIARAVVASPSLLLADEPTGNLDPDLSLRFMQLFSALHKSGTTILVATHDDKIVSKFNHSLLYLKNGAISRTRRPDERNSLV